MSEDINKTKKTRFGVLTPGEKHHYEIQCRECSSLLVDHHPRRDLVGGHVGGQFGRLLFWAALLAVDMRLQSSVKVVDAHARVNNGDHDEDDGDDGKERHRSPSR